MKKLLRREHVLLHELHVAKELGMTLTQLRREMTYEELWLWVTYFGLMKDRNKKQSKKHKDAVASLVSSDGFFVASNRRQGRY